MSNNGAILFFVIVAAAAILLQTVILGALFQVLRGLRTQVEGMLSRVESQASPVLATTRAIVDDARPKIADITANLLESSATVKTQVAHLAEATGEIVESARLQASRIDGLVEDTIAKIEVTTDLVQNGVINPVRRLHALVRGVSAGVGFLRATRARKKTENNSNQADEEMFI